MFKSLASLVLLLVLNACASKFTPSPHYANVTHHLDVGGDVLLYADVDGDLSATADYLDKTIEKVQKSYPDLKLDRIKAKRILQQLGLDQVVAMGLSSSRDGKAFHNKAFLEFGKERRGLLRLASSPAHDMEVARLAPSDADVAFENELQLKSLMDLIEVIVTDMGGKDGQKLFEELNEKLPGTSLSAKQVIGKLDTRIVGVLRVDYQRAFVAPGKEKITVPGFDLLLGIDNLAVVFDAYHGLLQALPKVKCTTEGDWQWVEFESPMPNAAWLTPVLAKNAKSGRLYAASSKAFVKEYLAEKSQAKPALAQTQEFQRATSDFHPRANALTFVSSALTPKLTRFAKSFGKDDKDAQAMIDIIVDLLPAGNIPFAAEQVHLPDGLYYASYAHTSHKAMLFPALVAGPSIVAGIAAAAVTRYTASERRAAELGPEDADAYAAVETPSDAVTEGPVGTVSGEPSEPGPSERYRVPLGGPSRGATQPTVVIVEFADFQCPFSARVSPTLEQLLQKYPDDVRIYFRNNPLPFHGDAGLAAQAALAAHAQNKFWPMYNVLFANQQNLSRMALESYAATASLNVARFDREMDPGIYSKAVANDRALAVKLNAQGTPYFFINGRPLVGAQPLEHFTEVIDEEIAKARELMAHGTQRRNLYTKLMSTATAPKASD